MLIKANGLFQYARCKQGDDNRWQLGGSGKYLY
jgi:hypothetical protein